MAKNNARLGLNVQDKTEPWKTCLKAPNTKCEMPTYMVQEYERKYNNVQSITENGSLTVISSIFYP